MNTTLKMWGLVIIFAIICRDNSKINLSNNESSLFHTRIWNFPFYINQVFGILPMDYSNWRQTVVSPINWLLYTGFHMWKCITQFIMHHRRCCSWCFIYIIRNICRLNLCSGNSTCRNWLFSRPIMAYQMIVMTSGLLVNRVINSSDW